jgi:hypothetical protein
VGAQNEIGFLAPDSCGSLVFQSILVDIPEEFREFGDVWQIHFIQNLLYFSTRKYLFRRNNDGTYKIWQAKNVLGQKVITLVNEFQQSGKYQVQWNASGFPSGVYYYQLETGNYRDVKKMFLLR